MKKPKQTVGWDEDEKGADSTVRFDLEDDDEEILDLEDIVDLEDEALDADDHLGLDAEILDADEDFDFDDLDVSRKRNELKEELVEDLEDDLLKDFSFLKDEKTGAEEEDDALGGLDEPLTIKPVDEEGDAAMFLTGAALGAAAVGVATSMPGGSRLDDVGPDVVTRVPPELHRTLDEVISSMETRLMDAVRAMVESKLPDIVREILREEIEKAKGLD